jgi:TRAP-type C4-dicarboxylate transport system permease small subunit
MTPFSGALIAAIMIIVNVQVLFRYVLRSSMGMISDLPPYFMVFVVWVSSVIVARKDEHIKIEILDGLIKSKKVLKWIKVVVKALMTIAMAIFSYYCCCFVLNAFVQGVSHPSLKVPYWIIYSVLPFSSILMTIHFGVNTLKCIKEDVK